MRDGRGLSARVFDLGGGFQHSGSYSMVFQHSGARDFDLGGGFQHSGSYPIRVPMVFQYTFYISGAYLQARCGDRCGVVRPYSMVPTCSVDIN